VISDEEIGAAVATLRRGGLVAFPTETVYGLGCDATSIDALARLYATKRRPTSHPVIVHLPDTADLVEWGRDLDEAAVTLARECWPGPLTLVVRRSERVPDAVTGGRDTVGLRVPDQPVAISLLRAFGGGIAAPSANRFGRVSPTAADDVRADLGSEVDVVLDGGPCTVGIESTIVDTTTTPAAILRVGAISEGRIAQLLGGRVDNRTAGEIAAPGTLMSHYSPDARVVLVDAGVAGVQAAGRLAAGDRVGLLAAEPVPRNLPAGVVVLDPPTGAAQYAHVLYARLRDADRLGLDVLLVVPPAAEGIGAAVADRLQRASTP
jgi:L-threonylcarbamoyladenylate synthase